MEEADCRLCVNQVTSAVSSFQLPQRPMSDSHPGGLCSCNFKDFRLTCMPLSFVKDGALFRLTGALREMLLQLIQSEPRNQSLLPTAA